MRSRSQQRRCVACASNKQLEQRHAQHPDAQAHPAWPEVPLCKQDLSVRGACKTPDSAPVEQDSQWPAGSHKTC